MEGKTEKESGEMEDYEMCDAGGEKTEVVEAPQYNSWIKPDDLNLKHRIGRGPFGDVWLATLHRSNQDFDEFHEVSAKMLSFTSPQQVTDLLPKLNYIFQRCQNLSRVSSPRGISEKNGMICIITKFYEGSIGDRMARLKENRLPLADVIRYGLNGALAVSELHSVRIMALNLKPCNFLLDDQDKVILGEFGIPSLILGMQFHDDENTAWLGTPNYMAPEQWEPDVRGPLSFETDSWGFACSIIEMFTGVVPWHGHSPKEIFSLVVRKRETPKIPNGLPPAIKGVIRACFEYDYRKRPSFAEIVQAFESPEVMFKEGDWVHVTDVSGGKPAVVKSVMGTDSIVLQYFDKKNELVNCDRINKMSLWSHCFQVGDLVQLKDSVVPQATADSREPIKTQGTIVMIDKHAGSVLVKFSEAQEPVHVSPAIVERVSSGFFVGDLVHLSQSPPSNSSVRSSSSVGVIHGIETSGQLKVAFLGREMLWICSPRELEKVKPFHVGQFIKVRKEVVSPRFQWPLRKDRCWDTGRISWIAPNGGLVVTFPGRLWNWEEWWADPEEVEVVQMQDYDNLIDKYYHLEAMHWGVRPLVLAVSSFIALKLGAGVIRVLPLPRKGSKGKDKVEQNAKIELAGDGQGKDAGNPTWLPPSVATILFGENAIATQS
ncbi:hypothetical protein GOP47_0011548 [Adiantum capillus-veneris]|uniref:Protein kinase domain-containing protein n=1 Tax=Adiantum capillus-veneris TaxID=13818 RepID=A0A9D4UTH6_ADICA|nr:hypothetical protein GOP47_0011548 [Adiantum capillus-veneris]